ncbi:hypothetical protein [Clostridium sp.]|uniref:hypothetical protein n=1 Tax=Clostridium sp. TaxID=1506 RepID=UPI00290EBE04|nr:hypothetical protein [Clostridium sp.]MDU5107326.1 hypothetical protein [Clostridium sp.]
MNDNLIEIKSIIKPKTPIIKIIDKNNFYDIYIFLQDLTKEEIIIKSINNFLILNLSLKNKFNDLLNFKRMLYLNKVDINTIENSVQANYIYLKVLKS